MNLQSNSSSGTRKRLLAAAASVAVAGAIGLGAVTSGTVPVFADPVRVDAPQVPSFSDVVEQVSPAVVSVRVKAKFEGASDDGSGFFSGPQGFDSLPDGHPLKRFFREFRGDGDRDGERRFRRDRRDGSPRPVSQGSGFFISEDGYLVTNNHVVEGGTEFTVVTNDGKELDAKLIGTDPRTDLAVLKVDDGNKHTYVDFADDAKVRVGDWVVAVGNPFGLGGTVTAGIVSARGRDIGAGPYDDFIQIDAAVNRGNSGGPAFNLNGEVVGVNTAIFSPSGGNVGIAFAIPASTVREVVGDLMRDGTVQRGWLGVHIQPVNKDIAESLGLKSEKGALVSQTEDDGPGKKAGIAAGDVITSVDGKEVASPRELARIIGAIQPGKSVEVTLWRDGKSETVKVDLGTLPGSDKQAKAEQTAPQDANALEDLGLTVTRAEDGKGVVVTDVEPGSDAADRGIQPGDVIVAVNSRDVSNSDEVTAAVADAAKSGRKAVLVQIMRDDTSRFVALPVAKG
ncbi:serine peptidase [Mesorhizobium sp. L-8-10]|uniref:Do family serine endopeptidase n=1 Tax=unclassified Mesorhizobium TaxID=325217 RepID=UPI0019273F99|nr:MULTISPECIES: Do family serine endopeptidase [unclassified Mesorhizobium]BCH25996.1 serine peptidase [Mesorhizobium sp. L-8-3]BCH33986.1 serine peptidase [Mesorhizobium sp. L-8-10]